jgi:hypothetical protein
MTAVEKDARHASQTVTVEASLGWTSPTDVEVIDLGRRGWADVKKDHHWGAWKAVGEALLIGRKVALREAHTNQPRGHAYKAAFSRWLADNGFSDVDKGDRARLFLCMDKISDIEQWRSTIGSARRAKLNHPSTVWRHFMHASKPSESRKAKRPAAPEMWEKKVRAAEERAKAAEEKARRAAGGSTIDFDKHAISDIAETIARGLVKPQRIRELIRALDAAARQLEKPRRADSVASPNSSSVP